MKTCTKCGIEKLEPDFSKCAKNKCGLRANCKSCEREYYKTNKENIAARMREYRKGNADKIAEYHREYYKSNAEKIIFKTSEYKNANKEKVAALSAKYLKASKEKRKEYRQANKKNIAEYKREYRQANPEKCAAHHRNRRSRKRIAEGRHTASDVLAILASQLGLCANCQTKLFKSGAKKYHVDHIMPLALGGSNWPSNLQCLCPSCNLSKGAKHPDDWAKENGRLL